jgi:hypothetical protein
VLPQRHVCEPSCAEALMEKAPVATKNKATEAMLAFVALLLLLSLFIFGSLPPCTPVAG